MSFSVRYENMSSSLPIGELVRVLKLIDRGTECQRKSNTVSLIMSADVLSVCRVPFK